MPVWLQEPFEMRDAHWNYRRGRKRPSTGNVKWKGEGRAVERSHGSLVLGFNFFRFFGMCLLCLLTR